MGCTLCILGFIFAAAVAFRIYLKLILKRNGSYTCLVGKTAIVTGANTGIGYVTALDLAQRGARVILGCRNKDKAEEAAKKIIGETGNQNVIYKIINMTSLSSVRQFAKEINEEEERLDILVNNAGAGGLGNHTTDDGIQITIHVNHISSFLLTHLLLDKLKTSTPSRIINVSSVTAKDASIDLDKFNVFPKDVHPARADIRLYGISKLCNILFTTELARKLDGTGVAVYTLHPGAVFTNIFRRVPKIAKQILSAVAAVYFKSPEEGAETTIYLATTKGIEHLTGQLFDNCTHINMYESAKNPALARKVWELSEQLSKLDEREKIN